MKKNNLFRPILITFLLFVILSWILEAGILYDGAYYAAGEKAILGIGNIFSLPFQAFYLFAENGLIFIIIGGMYGIFNATGAYKKITDKVTEWFQGKETLFIILTALFFLAFGSITGLTILGFALVPFFATILANLNFSKTKIMMSTVGTLIISTFASTLGFSLVTSYLTKVGKSELLGIKLMLFAITAIVLIVGLILKEKPHIKNLNDYKELDKKVNVPLEPTEKKYVSSIPLIIVTIFFGLLSIIGMYNWGECLGINIFSDFSTNVLAKIDFFNGFEALGSWGTKELAAIILIVCCIVSLMYKIKPSKMVDAFVEGAKPMIKVSLIATMCSIIFIFYYNSSNGYNFIDPIINNIYGGTADYMALKTVLAAPISSIMVSNSVFLTNNFATLFTTLSTTTSTLALSGLALQMAYGLSMLFLPTSMILMAGLAYFDLPYLKWLRYAYKYILVLFLIMGIILMV